LFIDSLMQERTWETKPANICHTVLSELLIEEFCEGVLTTNVDIRIEKEHRDISPQSGPNVISHDDFVAAQESRNDIYKIHGCLYKCPNRKYDSVWATSQFSSDAWPKGVNFAENLIKDFCQRRSLVFVGFNNCPGYLKRTLFEAIENNQNLKLYCVLPQDLKSVDPKFSQVINLSEDRFIQLTGEDFFPLVCQVVFEDQISRLFREKIPWEKGKYFIDGDEPIYKISVSDFDDVKNSLKKEIIGEDRNSFQKFLREVLQEEGRRDKYVSFKYASEQMARLFYWLSVFRLNFEEFIYCKSSSKHLLMHKDKQVIPLLIVNGGNKKPLDIIYQHLNKKIEQDSEFLYDIRNVFIYDALEYNNATKPEKIGSGNLIEREPHNIINASSVQYFPVTDHEMNGFLRKFTLEELKQNLDNLPWRF